MLNKKKGKTKTNMDTGYRKKGGSIQSYSKNHNGNKILQLSKIMNLVNSIWSQRTKSFYESIFHVDSIMGIACI